MNELHLFAGCGGGILGGILLGHTCVCAVELREYRRRVLLQRQRDGIFPRFPVWDNVETFDGRPTYAFVENAATLTVRGLGTVLGDLAEMGFNAKWGVLGAADAIWLEGTPVFDHERLRCFIKASHPDRIWQLQPQGGVSDKRGRPSNGIEAPAHANGLGQQSATTTQAVEIYSQGNASPFERARHRISMPITAANNGWWANEPGVGRMVHGLAHRDDRIAAIGDGQVPAVVKLAWETLTQ